MGLSGYGDGLLGIVYIVSDRIYLRFGIDEKKDETVLAHINQEKWDVWALVSSKTPCGFFLKAL